MNKGQHQKCGPKNGPKLGCIRKIAHFLFIDLWESTARRKKQRVLYRYQVFGSYRKERRNYFKRFYWPWDKKRR